MARAARGLIVAASAVVVALGLSGCGGSADPSAGPSQSGAGSSTAPSPSLSVAPAPDPVLQPAAGAVANLPYFELVALRFLTATPTPGGKPIITALVAAGFDRAAMQVTPDKTTIGNDVDSVQFSVRFADGCLIGQTSPAGFHAITGPIVAGNCLIGTTRPINW